MIVLKVYIAILLIQMILNFRKKRTGILACGLIGYCGGKPADPWILRLLFLYNLKRGEHATGICINNNIFKAAVPANKFLADNFALFHEVQTSKNFTIIGHDRQASVGSRDSVELAHPHAILEEDGRFKLILAHNGTIANMYALARKYKIEHDVSKHSDSLSLAKILASLNDEEGLQVLREYTGTATLLFAIPKLKNTLFVHRDPERELFYWQKADDEMYISSIKDSLMAVGGTDDTVKEFTGFELVKINRGRIGKAWDTKENRIPVEFSTPPPSKNVQRTPHIHGGRGHNADMAYHRGSEFYATEDFPNKVKENTDGLYCHDGRYFLNGQLYTGKLYFNTKDNSWSRSPFVGYTNMFFLSGTLMKDESNYDTLHKKCCGNNGFDAGKLAKIHTVDQSKYAMYPMKAQEGIVLGALFFPNKEHMTKFGKDDILTFTPIFSKYTYVITKRGTLVNTIAVNDYVKQTERKVSSGPEIKESNELRDNIRNVLTEATFNDITNLFNAVVISTGGKNEQNFFRKFCSEFIAMCDDAGVYPDQEVDKFTEAIITNPHAKDTYDSLSTLLEMYYLYLSECKALEEKKEGNLVLLSIRLEEFREENELCNDEHFKMAIRSVKFQTLDDLVVHYCVTDEEEVTKPVMQAIALELHAVGMIDEKTAYKTYLMKPGNSFQELHKWYELWSTLQKPKEEVTCCEIMSPTDIFAMTYVEAKSIELKAEKTPAEEEKLSKLKNSIRESLIKEVKLDEAILANKYGVTLNLIIEEYAGDATR